MKKILHQWNVLKSVAFVTYKEWSAYRTHSMVSILTGPTYFLVQFFIWSAVYKDTGNMNGMNFEATIAYYAAITLIGYLTMDFADWNLSMLVHTGKFLTFALRPIHHRFFAFSQKIGHRFLGFLFEFLPCWLIFQYLFRINLVPEHKFWSILSILLAFLMNFYVNYILGLLSFWLVQAGGIREVFGLISRFFSGALIPLVFFPKWLQWIQFFLPFQYTSYVPAMVVTGQYSLGGITMPISQIVGIQAIAVLVTFLGSELLYRCAIKHFTGVGA